MDAQTTITAAALAEVTARTASIVTLHSYVNHGLLGLVVFLLGIIGWFGRGTLRRIETKICSKADKEQNDGDHKALFSHYHAVEIEGCQPNKKCKGEAGDLMVPHGG